MEHGRCPFEKAILGALGGCELATRFSVAERLGVNCRDDIARNNCITLLALMRDRARFALKVTDTSDPLPFGKEMKVMIGGLIGLQRLFAEEVSQVDNIHELVRQAQGQFGSLESIPYHEIVKSITAYQAKRRGRGSPPR